MSLEIIKKIRFATQKLLLEKKNLREILRLDIQEYPIAFYAESKNDYIYFKTILESLKKKNL